MMMLTAGRYFTLIAGLGCLAAGIASMPCGAAPSESAPAAVYLDPAPLPLTEAEQIAHLVGWQRGHDYRARGVRLDLGSYLLAFFAAQRGLPSPLSSDERLFLTHLAQREAQAPTDSGPKRIDIPARLSLTDDVKQDVPGSRTAHAFGYSDGWTQHRLDLALAPQGFATGFAQGYSGAGAQLTAARFDTLNTRWQTSVQTRQVLQNRAAAAAGAAFAARFLAEHPQATVLPSGTVYRVLVRGTGPLADGNDLVRVHYIARRVDGSVFEDTHALADGEPANLPVPGMLEGMREVLTREPAGTELIAVIPGKLLYGATWTAELPGESTLIFEFSLGEIVPYPGEVP
jgi:FKBP-type peptidyl-prolyl cis-trans isomerase